MRRTVLRELAARVDVVIADEDEARVVTGATADAPTRGPRRGAPRARARRSRCSSSARAGRSALERGASSVIVAGLAVPVVVDPVGAGDAFCAGFIAARLDGLDLADALGWANACGAAAVAAEGDQTGLPTAAELARLLETGGPDTLR